MKKLSLILSLLVFLFSAGLALADEPNKHVVQEGETVWAVAYRYTGIPSMQMAEELMAANALESTVVYPGQVLNLPANWPDYFEVAPEMLAKELDEGHDHAGGMEFDGRFFRTGKIIWSPFKNPSGYWPFSNEDRPQAHFELPLDRQWTIFPLGVRWDGQALHYQQSESCYECGYHYPTVWKTKPKIRPYLDYNWRPAGEAWDKLEFSYFFYEDVHYSTMFLVRKNKDHIYVDVYAVSMLQVTETDWPERFEAIPFPESVGVKPGDVNWKPGEMLTVTQVIWNWHRWENQPMSVWKIIEPYREAVQLERESGEKYWFTGYYDLFLERTCEPDEHCVSSSFSLTPEDVGMNLWVDSFTYQDTDTLWAWDDPDDVK